MATIKDISKALGVSVSTVSMALNDSKQISELTKSRVRATADKMNYVRNGAAVNLQRSKTNTVLFITDNPARPYFIDAMKALQDSLQAENFDLIIATSNAKNSRSTTRFLTERRADAVICWSQFVSSKLINKVASAEMPIFTLGRDTTQLTNPYVFNLNVHQERTGEEITNYLIQHDFKHIAFVHNNNRSVGSDLRRHGYLTAMKAANLDTLMFSISTSDYQSGYDVTQEKLLPLVREKQIDAIFYTNDDVAIGGLHCFLKAGVRVPEDVSLVGYNNYQSSILALPQITTVSLHESEIMQKMADEVLNFLCKNEKAQQIHDQLSTVVMDSEIIERDTVKK